MKKFRTQRGITLIELMSSIVIVGIVAAMAVPRFAKTMERIKFRTANRDIVSSLKMARSMAVSGKEQFGVHFNNENLTYTLFKDVTNPASYAFEESDSLISVDTLPAEFAMLVTSSTTDAVVFLPNGSVGISGGGTVDGIYIVTYAETEDFIGIHDHQILPSTGRVSSFSYYY